jgi:hypothetical protein
MSMVSFSLYVCTTSRIISFALVAVKSVSIDEETTGQEDAEMVISCSAVGGRPLPVISWHIPESVEFETEEESEILVDIQIMKL